jgi:uncharacterized protein YdcH (DUF465 family)
MNDADRKLIEQLSATHQELNKLVQAHRAFEDQLDEMGSRRYLSEQERQEMARIKKQKLRGKDRILQILAEHRRADS